MKLSPVKMLTINFVGCAAGILIVLVVLKSEIAVNFSSFFFPLPVFFRKSNQSPNLDLDLNPQYPQYPRYSSFGLALVRMDFSWDQSFHL